MCLFRIVNSLPPSPIFRRPRFYGFAHIIYTCMYACVSMCVTHTQKPSTVLSTHMVDSKGLLHKSKSSHEGSSDICSKNSFSRKIFSREIAGISISTFNRADNWSSKKERKRKKKKQEEKNSSWTEKSTRYIAKHTFFTILYCMLYPPCVNLQSKTIFERHDLYAKIVTTT